ncbi:hypothetical protein [Candidatus Poriferisocius sp.]|uniref:hypothetical protein n=1 Tax=Candidatus Poriferisocius sp. TaxID=3101276 RepID=UPI003B014DCB
MTTGSLADHAELMTNRNLAAVRAERAAAEFVDGCGGRGCNPAVVNTTRIDGTALVGCTIQDANSTILRVRARITWAPRVLIALTPATATVAVDLGGFAVPARAVLERC